MNEENNARQGNHNVIIENRGKMMITGVLDVLSFDELEIVMSTELGELTVNGEGLNILNLSHETGELDVEGEVIQLTYTHHQTQKSSLFTRLFK